MDKHKLRAYVTSAALITGNLVPLWGVFFGGWNVAVLFLLYWLENIVVGLFSILRMATCWDPAQGRSENLRMKALTIPFFIFHYGAFTAWHGIMLYAFFHDLLKEAATSPLPALGAWTWLGWRPGGEFLLALVSLVASHTLSFILFFLVNGEFRKAKAPNEMLRPYVRIVLLHVTILVGAFPVALTGQASWAVVLFVALKIGMDLRAHWAEHKSRAQAAGEGETAADGVMSD